MDEYYNKKVFSIKADHTIRKSTEIYSVSDAFTLLETKDFKQALSAARVGDQVRISWARICCPHCGKQVPFIDPDKTTIPDHEVFTEIFGNQISMFSQDKKVVFNSEIASFDSFRCPKCNEMYRVYDKEEIILNSEESDSSIRISFAVGMYEVFDCDWIDNSVATNASYELRECITFSMEDGQTYLSLIDSDNRCLASRDITNARVSFIDGKLCKYFNDYFSICSITKTLLQDKYNDLFPGNDLSLEYLIIMNRYLSYRYRRRARRLLSYWRSSEGYEYILMDTQKEYSKASIDVVGNEGKCVADTLAYDYVIGVYQYDHYIAMILIADNSVEELRLNDNLSDNDKTLFLRSFRSWLEHCNYSSSVIEVE